MNNQIPTEKELEEIEKNYDPQLSFRKLGVKLEVLVSFIISLNVSLACVGRWFWSGKRGST
jgi:hypothetical protein